MKINLYKFFHGQKIAHLKRNWHHKYSRRICEYARELENEVCILIKFIDLSLCIVFYVASSFLILILIKSLFHFFNFFYFYLLQRNLSLCSKKFCMFFHSTLCFLVLLVPRLKNIYSVISTAAVVSQFKKGVTIFFHIIFMSYITTQFASVFVLCM